MAELSPVPGRTPSGEDFAHLHTHTEFSLLDGASRIKELVHTAKSMGQTSIAITDHGVLYGAIDFYTEAKAAGINPIIGCEVYMAQRSRHDKDQRIDREPWQRLLKLEMQLASYLRQIADPQR